MERIEVLDESGRPIGVMPRDEAHRRGLLHRCVHVFVLDPQGQLWLQQRAMDRRLWPGLWTSSASGHVEAGEDEGFAAAREVEEELGLVLQPRRVAEFRYRDEHENELASLWEGRTDAQPEPGPEVMAVRAVSRVALQAWMRAAPREFAPSFRAALRAYGWES